MKKCIALYEKCIRSSVYFRIVLSITVWLMRRQIKVIYASMPVVARMLVNVVCCELKVNMYNNNNCISRK